ncbi:MAG TPA: FHA domain-containing protein, partial [Vicinamibacteria bacterium]
MSGERLRLASLSVLGGSLHGRKRDLEEVVAEVLVGSDPDCHLVVDLPSVSPIHARLWTDLDQAEVHDTRAPRGVFVNTERVDGQAILRPGDMLWLGPPQDPGSVCIKCHFEPWVEVLPGGEEPEAVDESPAPGPPVAPLSAASAGSPVGEFDLDVTEAASREIEVEGVTADVDAYEAVVVGGDDAEDLVVAAGVEEVVEEPGPAALAGLEPPPAALPAPVETEAPASPASDPFFVGEAQPEPTVAAAEDETTFVFDEEEPAASAAPEPAEAADDWAIAEAPAAAVPEPAASDEFFLAEEPAAEPGASVE